MAGTGGNCLLLGKIRKERRLREGEAAVEIHPRLTPRPGDVVTRRVHALSAFHGTELDTILRNAGVDTLVLVGVSTHAGRASRR